MVAEAKATTCHFIPDYIRNYVDIRNTESHTIIKNDGKTVQMTEIVTNNDVKTSKNTDCNVFKWPILPDLMPFRSKKGWDFVSPVYIGDDIQCQRIKKLKTKNGVAL